MVCTPKPTSPGAPGLQGRGMSKPRWGCISLSRQSIPLGSRRQRQRGKESERMNPSSRGFPCKSKGKCNLFSNFIRDQDGYYLNSKLQHAAIHIYVEHIMNRTGHLIQNSWNPFKDVLDKGRIKDTYLQTFLLSLYLLCLENPHLLYHSWNNLLRQGVARVFFLDGLASLKPILFHHSLLFSYC